MYPHCYVIINIVILFITHAGATYIKNMLTENRKLQQLGIGRNKIGNDGMKHVIEGLQYNNTLTRLNAVDCGFSVEGSQLASVITTL